MYFDQIVGGQELASRVDELEGRIHNLASELKDVKADLARVGERRRPGPVESAVARAEERRDELTKAQEELTNARYLLSYWRNVSREQTGKIKAAEERAVEAESKLDQVRRFAENNILGAHSKVAYIRNVVRP